MTHGSGVEKQERNRGYQNRPKSNGKKESSEESQGSGWQADLFSFVITKTKGTIPECLQQNIVSE